MAWTNLTFAYGSVLTSTKMTQMYDNFAYGAGSVDPTFITPALGTPASGALDNCTSNTEAVGTNNTQLATTAFCEAGFVNNDVGVLGVGSRIRGFKESAGTIASGATVAGSDLRECRVSTDGAAYPIFAFASAAIGSGTWRNISPYTAYRYTDTSAPGGEFQRIS